MEKVYLLLKSPAPEAHMPLATWPCPAARGEALGNTVLAGQSLASVYCSGRGWTAG